MMALKIKSVCEMLKRFPLFASGSAIGAVIDYVVTLFSSHYLDLYPAVALAIAMIVSGSTVFFFHVRITYRDTTGNLFRRYILFMSWTCLIFFLRAIVLQGCLYTGLPLAVALFIALAFVSIINFIISTVIIFAKKPS